MNEISASPWDIPEAFCQFKRKERKRITFWNFWDVRKVYSVLSSPREELLLAQTNNDIIAKCFMHRSGYKTFERKPNGDETKNHRGGNEVIKHLSQWCPWQMELHFQAEINVTPIKVIPGQFLGP